jgi:hypothetical protein
VSLSDGVAADVDQWGSDTCKWLADLAHSGAATWHTLSLHLFFILSASHTQFVPRAVIVPKLYPEKP